MKKQVRNSNFELMRICSMFFIIIFHIIRHGNVIENCTNPAIQMVLELIMCLLIVHVNSFVLLSGYFQSKSKFKLSKILKLLLQVIFYSIIILIIGIKHGWISEYSIISILNNLNLTSLSNYWFIKLYLVLYVFSDYINKYIKNLKREEYKNFLIIGFIVLSIIPFITGHRVFDNNGFSLINFIYLYMIGGYLRKYPLKETYHFINMSINGYRMFLLFGFTFLGFLSFTFNHLAIEINGMSHIFTEISSRITPSYLSYSTPFVMLQTVLYFELFRTFNINNHIINKISNTVFGIYLLHDHEIIRVHIYKLLKIDNGLFGGYSIFPKIILVALFIFIICSIIEGIRQWVFKWIQSTRISKKGIKRFRNFIDSFNFHINW